jgi:transcriptional regulatory protein LevR
MSIHIHNVDEFFEFLNSYNQDLTLDGLLDIRMQTVLKEAKETGPDPEKWITLILKCIEGLGTSETCIKVLKDREQQKLDKELRECLLQ